MYLLQKFISGVHHHFIRQHEMPAGTDLLVARLTINHKPERSYIMEHSPNDTPIEDSELKLIRKFLLEHPYIDKSIRDRGLKLEEYADDIKSLINMYPVKKSNP